MLQMESSPCERIGFESVAGAAGVAFRPHRGVSCGYRKAAELVVQVPQSGASCGCRLWSAPWRELRV